MVCERFSLVVLLGLALLLSPAGAEVDFIRGDVNGDGVVDLVDSAGILKYLFAGEEPQSSCMDMYDANDDDVCDIADAIRIVQYRYCGGPPIDPPFPEAGTDPTTDAFECEGFSTYEPVSNEGIVLSIDPCVIAGGNVSHVETLVRVTSDVEVAAVQFTLRL